MLTKQHEASQPTPWKMADAPRAYTDARLNEIVGIEIPITRIIGKTKASQNRSDEDRRGVIDGLTEIGETAMAEIVERKLDECCDDPEDVRAAEEIIAHNEPAVSLEEMERKSGLES